MFNEDAGPGNPAPNFAQHTNEVLAEIAGLTQERIHELRSSGAIA
jgi:crotonobetainyl-CoA:carnitine CoA-transferase CaiB-like acyl-CoA transferase